MSISKGLELQSCLSFRASYMPPSHCQDPVSLGSPIFFILGIGETMDLADRSQGIKVFVEILSL